MKKFFLPILCILITCGAGYKGTLPDLEKQLEHKRKTPKTSIPKFNVNKFSKDKNLKKIPRKNKTYIKIILKKDKTSEYITDVNDIILILEKLKS